MSRRSGKFLVFEVLRVSESQRIGELLCRSGVGRENGADSQFINGTDNAANVMTQNFSKDFVLHSNIGFATHVVAELRLDHHDSGFDIAAFVVMDPYQSGFG